jgi:hypothetical protein
VTYGLFAAASCTGKPISTSAVTLADGLVPHSRTTSGLAEGSYSFQAAYAGSPNYQASTGACEPFSVAKATSVTATAVFDSTTHRRWSGTETQGAFAYDTATVAGVAGFVPSGTLTYRFFPSRACTGAIASSQRVTLVNGKVPSSVSTKELPSGLFSYRATYSGSTEYRSSTGSCESFGAFAVGYRLVGGEGSVFDYHVPFYGSAPGLKLQLFNFVGLANTSKGYWLVESNGGIFSFGNAFSHGSLPQRRIHVSDIVGIAATPTGKGYWMVGSNGTVYSFGDAVNHGSLPGRGIHVSDIVAIVSPDAGGYWLVGANGSVYPFGDAHSLGSCAQATSGCKGVSDIVGAANIGGTGYWLAGKNGRVFGFGTAHSHGSCPQTGSGCNGADNIVGIASPDADGYWLAEANGKVIRFGDARFFGDRLGKQLTRPIVGIS